MTCGKTSSGVYLGGSGKHFHALALSGSEAEAYRNSGDIPQMNLGRVYVVPSFGDIAEMFEPSFHGGIQKVLFVPYYPGWKHGRYLRGKKDAIIAHEIRKSGGPDKIEGPVLTIFGFIEDSVQSAVVVDFGYTCMKEFLERECGSVAGMRKYVPGSRVTLFTPPDRFRRTVLAGKHGRYDDFVYRAAGDVGRTVVSRDETFILGEDDRGIFVKGFSQKEIRVPGNDRHLSDYERLLLEDEERFRRKL